MPDVDRRGILAAGTGILTGAGVQRAAAETGRRSATAPEVVWSVTAESTLGTWYPLDDLGLLVERPAEYRYDGDGHAVSLVDTEAGRRLERFETPGYVWATIPRTAEGDVLVYARPSQDLDDGTTGHLLRIDLADRTTTAVATYDGHPMPVYVPGVFAVERGGDADVRRVDPVDGSTVWRRDFDHSLLYPGTTDRLLFTANAGAQPESAVTALDLEDGSTRNRTVVDGTPTGGTFARSGSAAVPTEPSGDGRGRLHVFDGETGDRRWKTSTGAGADDRVVPVLGDGYAGYRAGNTDPEATAVGVFDVETGDRRFEATVEGARPWDLRFRGRVWYAFGGDGLRAFDVEDGAKLWSVDLSTSEFPWILGQSALLADGATVRSVGLPDGNVRWERTFEGDVDVSGYDLLDDGTERLYASVGETVFALEGRDVSARTPTPTPTATPTATATPSPTAARISSATATAGSGPTATPAPSATPTPIPGPSTDGAPVETTARAVTATPSTDAAGPLPTWLTVAALGIAGLARLVRSDD